MAACPETAQNVQNRQNMLLRIAKSDAVVKSQQRGEPDLSELEKVVILDEILERNPGCFLMRFGKHLAEEDLDNFEHLKGDYEIEFRLKELKNLSNIKKRKTGVRNRRFECLQRLMKDSDYFSEQNMRHRSPLLYEQYIGQYLTEEEKYERDNAEIGKDPSLSTLIMSRQEKEMNDWMVGYQRAQEECMLEENESESDSDTSEGLESGSPLKGCPTETEKHMLHEEFLSAMQDKFMRGEEEFDYSAVDANEDYDDLMIRGRDEEERYFDEDDNLSNSET